MSFPVETDYKRWGHQRHDYTPDEFMALNSLPSGLIIIGYSEVELALLVENRGADTTFYGFHAAQSPLNRRPVPYFQGRRIAPKRMNQVLVCDPSLYLHDDVRVGWFLGNPHCPMEDIWPGTMDKIDAMLGSARRLLWGNSAGGTAALLYARDEDVSVVMNPQINLRAFTWSRVQPWLYYAHGFDIEEYFEGAKYGDKHLDLASKMGRGRIVYCQNKHDDHVELQLKPFAEAHGFSTEPGDDGKFRLILDDWGKGHIPPPSAEQAAIVAEEVERMLGPEPRLFSRLLGR